jgi:hypothetical protein
MDDCGMLACRRGAHKVPADVDKKSPAVMPPAIFCPDETGRTEIPSGLFQLLKPAMPGASVAESLRSFLEFRNRTTFRTCAEADLTARHAELLRVELVVRVFHKKLQAATERTLHGLFPP